MSDTAEESAHVGSTLDVDLDAAGMRDAVAVGSRCRCLAVVAVGADGTFRRFGSRSRSSMSNGCPPGRPCNGVAVGTVGSSRNFGSSGGGLPCCEARGRFGPCRWLGPLDSQPCRLPSGPRVRRLGSLTLRSFAGWS